LHDSVDGRQEITHALNITQRAVVFIIGQEHILHLLKMDIGTNISKRRVGIRMWSIFAGKKWYMTIGSMDIFFYSRDPKKWDESVSGLEKWRRS
jgi:hypothetical protein